MGKSVYVCNENADKAIAGMMATVVGTALVPAHVNWALTASAMGAGVVAIGLCYDIKLSKDEGWKLVKQFIMSAGFWFLSMNVGSKILSALMETTGIGYGAGVAIDAATSAAFAWAIGLQQKNIFKESILERSNFPRMNLVKYFVKHLKIIKINNIKTYNYV